MSQVVSNESDLFVLSLTRLFTTDAKTVHLFKNLIRVKLLDFFFYFGRQKLKRLCLGVFQRHSIHYPTVLKRFQHPVIFTWVVNIVKEMIRFYQILDRLMNFFLARLSRIIMHNWVDSNNCIILRVMGKFIITILLSGIPGLIFRIGINSLKFVLGTRLINFKIPAKVFFFKISQSTLATLFKKCFFCVACFHFFARPLEIVEVFNFKMNSILQCRNILLRTGRIKN